MSVSGPTFLLFYAALALAANLWLRRHFRTREAGPEMPALRLSEEPYRVAFLRSGKDEAARLAMFSLLDRGLLAEHEGKLHVARADAESLLRRPIERAVLACFRSPMPPETALADTALQRACDDYAAELQSQGLLAGRETLDARFQPFFLTLAVLLAVSFARIFNAILQGRHNIGFLIALTLIGAIALIPAWRNRLTGRGIEALRGLQRLFAGLKARAKALRPRDTSADAILLAGVFGLAALPATAFPFVGVIQPKSSSGGDGGGDSSSDGGDSGGCGG